MDFEWDDNKNQQNIAKHGISFEQASAIFEGFTLDAPDDRFDYGEERTISLGMISHLMKMAHPRKGAGLPTRARRSASSTSPTNEVGEQRGAPW